MTRRVLVLFALMIPACGFTQGDATFQRVVSSPTDIAQLVATASSEILLAVPVLRSYILADALREAMIVRGVQVYVLVPLAGMEDRASYLLSLQLVGARVRLGDVQEGLLVLDRQAVVTGPLLAAPDAKDGGVARGSHDPHEVHRAITWFYEAFRTARTYERDPRTLQGGNDDW